MNCYEIYTITIYLSVRKTADLRVSLPTERMIKVIYLKKGNTMDKFKTKKLCTVCMYPIVFKKDAYWKPANNGKTYPLNTASYTHLTLPTICSV